MLAKMFYPAYFPVGQKSRKWVHIEFNFHLPNWAPLCYFGKHEGKGSPEQNCCNYLGRTLRLVYRVKSGG